MDNLIKLERLGEGTYGTVFKVRYRVSHKRRPIAKIFKVVISHYFTVPIITE